MESTSVYLQFLYLPESHLQVHGESHQLWYYSMCSDLADDFSPCSCWKSYESDLICIVKNLDLSASDFWIIHQPFTGIQSNIVIITDLQISPPYIDTFNCKRTFFIEVLLDKKTAIRMLFNYGQTAILPFLTFACSWQVSASMTQVVAHCQQPKAMAVCVELL